MAIYAATDFEIENYQVCGPQMISHRTVVVYIEPAVHLELLSLFDIVSSTEFI